MTEEDKWRKAYRILFPNDDYSNMPCTQYRATVIRKRTDQGVQTMMTIMLKRLVNQPPQPTPN